jgi:transposase
VEVNTIAIDLAKNVFALCAANGAGELIWRKELRRAQLLSFMRRQRPCVVGMEACGGAHYWARQFAALGHAIRLVSPALVTPYRKGNKTDRNDAEAILEAITRPSMRFVAVKSVAQQDLLALHRVRSQLLKNRTAVCNQLRGLLRERGVAVRVGVTALRCVADDTGRGGEQRDLG